MANIFISYNRQTKAITKALVDDVEALGHTVWFDEELGGGQAWWDQILSMIRRCDLFIFVLDPAALNSTACKLEYGYAADLRKPILPILVSEGVSTNLLPPSLSQIQFVDYRHQDHTAALRLARAFSAVPPPAALPDPLPVPPGAPISYLGSLAVKVETTSLLTYEEQSALVFDLKKGLRDPETADDTRTLLKTFRKRRDLLAGIAEEIDELFEGLRETSSASPRASGMTPPFLEQPQKEETISRFPEDESEKQRARRSVPELPQDTTPPSTPASVPPAMPSTSIRSWVILGGVCVAIIAAGLLANVLRRNVGRTELQQRQANTPGTPAVATTPYEQATATPAAVATAKPYVAEQTPATTMPSSTPGSSGYGATAGYNPAMAFIDMQRAFKEYNKTKDAEVKINDAKNAAKREYDNRAEAYKKALDEINALNKQLESPNLSSTLKTANAQERDKKIANIKNMEKEINDFRQTRERQLQEQLMRMREGIVKEITAKVEALAGTRENIVFDKSGMSVNGVPVLIFSPEGGDMSNKVITSLNASSRSSSSFTATRDLKIATVDMQRAFKEYNKTKDAEAKINDAKNAARKEYDDRAENYKKALDEINALNKQLESPNLSSTSKTAKAQERDKKIAEIKNMEKEINDFRQTRERQLQEQLMRMREGIVKEITQVLAGKIKAKGVDLVLDVSGISLNGVPVVLYRRGIPDCTDEALATLNRTHGSTDALGSPESSRAQRFAVVDMNRLFKAWPETRTAEAEIDQEKAAAQKEYADKSAAEREKREKELQEKAKTLRDRIVGKMLPVVSTCAARANFNLVFDSSGPSLNGVPVLVLIRDLPDLTDEVLKDQAR